MKSFDHRKADGRRQFRLGGVRGPERTEHRSFLPIEPGSDRGGHAAVSGYLITAPVPFFATQGLGAVRSQPRQFTLPSALRNEC
jgi:hypothetical protein